MHVQKESFKEEITTLKFTSAKAELEGTTKPRKSQVKKSSKIFKLDPQLTDGLLRVGGRLEKAPFQLDAKHPIILPVSHHVVRLIIEFYHHASGHSGSSRQGRQSKGPSTTASTAESGKHQLESRKWQPCHKTGSPQTSLCFPMLASTVSDPFWFAAGGAKPRDMA